MSSAQDRPLVAVVVFPGSNDDRDAQLALTRLGADARRVWHTDPSFPAGTRAVVLPGGFSYGDYLRCGAIARFSPILEAVGAFAGNGGPVLGICNGFQILTEAGLLPGVLRPNASLSFVCRDVPVLVERAETPLLSRCRAGQELRIPVKHGEGCWFADDDLLAELEAAGQIALRYGPGSNPNGSVADVAGVINAEGNVLGLMPHPEHAVDALLGSVDGALIMGSLIDAAQLSVSAARLGLTASLEPQQLAEGGSTFELGAEPSEVTLAQRDRTATHDTVGGVREANEPLTTRCLQELEHGRKPLLAGALRECEPFDHDSRSPRSRRACRLRPVRCHATNVAASASHV